MLLFLSLNRPPLGDDIKPCPRCAAYIIKMNDGSCNHMTCAVCGCEFCWLCMKEISDLHYLRWNKQYSRNLKSVITTDVFPSHLLFFSSFFCLVIWHLSILLTEHCDEYVWVFMVELWCLFSSWALEIVKDLKLNDLKKKKTPKSKDQCFSSFSPFFYISIYHCYVLALFWVVMIPTIKAVTPSLSVCPDNLFPLSLQSSQSIRLHLLGEEALEQKEEDSLAARHVGGRTRGHRPHSRHCHPCNDHWHPSLCRQKGES